MALRQSVTQSVQCVPLGAIIPLQRWQECCHAIPNRCRGDKYGFTGANAPFMLCPLTRLAVARLVVMGGLKSVPIGLRANGKLGGRGSSADLNFPFGDV